MICKEVGWNFTLSNYEGVRSIGSLQEVMLPDRKWPQSFKFVDQRHRCRGDTFFWWCNSFTTLSLPREIWQWLLPLPPPPTKYKLFLTATQTNWPQHHFYMTLLPSNLSYSQRALLCWCLVGREGQAVTGYLGSVSELRRTQEKPVTQHYFTPHSRHVVERVNTSRVFWKILFPAALSAAFGRVSSFLFVCWSQHPRP